MADSMGTTVGYIVTVETRSGDMLPYALPPVASVEHAKSAIQQHALHVLGKPVNFRDMHEGGFESDTHLLHILPIMEPGQ